MPIGTLYILATPIGNLQDITLRALDTLKSVGYIACEDTRVTRKLLEHYDIHVPMVRVDAHAGAKEFSRVVEDVRAGKDIAVVSDAGTPGISDPGSALVSYVLRHVPEVLVVAIPGPSAITAALSIAGFLFDRFVFTGFPPAKKGRKNYFETIADEKSVVVFYESVHRIRRTLEELGEAIGERSIVVTRELTKQFESVYRGSARDVLAHLTEKGEFVVVVSPIK